MKYIHTITEEDVRNFYSITRRTNGRCDFFRLKNTMGNLLSGDIGKRVYEVGSIYQVENDEQRDKRLS